ncbi:MAG: hypothetical protein JNJ40_14230 [Bacteroidia bacterium]|nr:hypothetical protein [Bacteroidia bacterium]
MLSLIKNSTFCFLIICLFSACESETIVVEEPCEVLSESTDTHTLKVTSAKSHTILLSGMIPPPKYANAQDIVERVYNIHFKYAAGCIVDEQIGDSISKCNERTFTEMQKQYDKDMAKEIYDRLDAETAFLTKLDSIIRSNPEIKKQKKLRDQMIYYSKKDKKYIAHFIVSEPDYKVLNFKLKLVLTVDSATKALSNFTVKDSLINNFSDLQL